MCCAPPPLLFSKLQLYVRSEASRRPYSQSILSGRPSTDSVGGVDMGSLYSGSDAARAYHGQRAQYEPYAYPQPYEQPYPYPPHEEQQYPYPYPPQHQYGEPYAYPGSGYERYGADPSPHDVHPSGAAAYGDAVRGGSAHDGHGVDEHVSDALSNLHTSAAVAVGGAWPAHPQGKVHSVKCDAEPALHILGSQTRPLFQLVRRFLCAVASTVLSPQPAPVLAVRPNNPSVIGPFSRPAPLLRRAYARHGKFFRTSSRLFNYHAISNSTPTSPNCVVVSL